MFDKILEATMELLRLDDEMKDHDAYLAKQAERDALVDALAKSTGEDPEDILNRADEICQKQRWNTIVDEVTDDDNSLVMDGGGTLGELRKKMKDYF